MNLQNIAGKKIELLPQELKENQIHCKTCGGIGWLEDTEIHTIKMCPDCIHGAVNICPICKKPYPKYSHECTNIKCKMIQQYALEHKIVKKIEDGILQDMKLFEKVEKYDCVNAFDKFDMLYSDAYDYHDGYFTNWDDFFDKFKDLEREYKECFGTDMVKPEYVWGTYSRDLQIDADGVIEYATEEMWEGAAESCDYKSLQKLLDDWCKEQTGATTYYVDYEHAVKIPWEEYNKEH